MVTGEVDIGNLVATVNACGSHLLALVVGVVQKGRQMADERALEGAVEYGLLVVDKDAHTGSLKGIDDAGAVVYYLVVDIGVGRVTAAQTLALGRLEKARNNSMVCSSERSRSLWASSISIIS